MSVFVHGAFNVEKCVAYLRSVGVEISDVQAQEWRDAERTERFCRSMKRTAREGADYWCENGHQRYEERRKGQRKRKGEWRCAECGARFNRYRLRWTESSDGTVKDYRPRDERWKPLDWRPPPVGQDLPPTALG